MSTKPSSQPKRKSAPPKAKAKAARPKKRSRSFQEVVGPEVYGAWVSMLGALVPDGRTHRLSLLVAAMLQYACGLAEDKRDDDDDDENSITQSLLASTEVFDPSEVEELLHDAVAQLFKDANVEYHRTSARGQDYSIAEEAYSEYIHWFDMPWE